MGNFHKFEEEIVDWSRPLKLSTKVPKTRKDIDGNNPEGADRQQNPTQKRNRPIGISQKQAAKKKIPNTRNDSNQRRPKENGFDSPDGETLSKVNRSKKPNPIGNIPKAKQHRIPIGRNKDFFSE